MVAAAKTVEVELRTGRIAQLPPRREGEAGTVCAFQAGDKITVPVAEAEKLVAAGQAVFVKKG